jgi:hypothetical protein
MRGSVDMNFLFTLGEVQRMMRYADRRHAGIPRNGRFWPGPNAPRAWQSELPNRWRCSHHADAADRQNSTTMAVERAAQNRHVSLYLRKAAPLLGKLAGLAPNLTATALDGINPAPTACSPNSTRSRKTFATRSASTGDLREGQRYGPIRAQIPGRAEERPASPARPSARRTARDAMAACAACRFCCWWCCRWSRWWRAFYLNGGRYVTTDDAMSARRRS